MIDMNSKQANILLQKHNKYEYEARFLLPSKNGGGSPKSPKSPTLKSQSLQLLGGESALDILSIYFAERIAKDAILAEVIYYGDLNAKALVQIQKELLLFALRDDLDCYTNKQVCKQKILQQHVRLGLMEREAYFDRLTIHLAYALNACSCQLKDVNAVFLTQRRFEALRALLQITRDHMELESEKMELIRFPFLGNLVGKKLKKRMVA